MINNQSVNSATMKAKAKNEPHSQCDVRSGSRRRHVVMISLLAKVGRINSLYKITDRHGRHVHVHCKLQFPRADFRVTVNAGEPQPGIRQQIDIQCSALC